jgi:hypothetical protein
MTLAERLRLFHGRTGEEALALIESLRQREEQLLDLLRDATWRAEKAEDELARARSRLTLPTSFED